MKKISLMMSIMILSLALLCFSGCKENLAQPTTDYNFSVSDYSITIEIPTKDLTGADTLSMSPKSP